MPNFYKDNDDIQFHMKHIDLDWVIELKEENFADKGKFDYAKRYDQTVVRVNTLTFTRNDSKKYPKMKVSVASMVKAKEKEGF